MMQLDPAAAVPLAIALRLATVLLTLGSSRRLRVALAIAFGGSAVASIVTATAAATVLSGAPPAHGVLFVHGASGFSMGFTLDALSAWFLLTLSLLAIPIAIFSIGYSTHLSSARRSLFLGVAFNVLVGTVEYVFIADSVVGFLFAWELMTLTTAGLVVTEHEARENRRAAYLYLVMSHVGTGCLIAGMLVLASMTDSMAFSAMLAGNAATGPLRGALFVLFFVGFGVKAGVIPLHVWLPEAHPAAPTSISALMSSVLIKTGIYGIVRFCVCGLGTPDLAWGVIVVVLGGLSSVLGVLYALMQHDLKRLLAYHSIENIGIILLGLGAGMMALSAGHGGLAAVGIAAALYHVLNHAVFKGLLFLGAGSVVVAMDTRQIEEMGGLQRRMPWTASFFLVGALAISGLPPLNGFASEWLTFQAFLYGFHESTDTLIHTLFPAAGALLALTSALAAACFVKAFGITFLALPRTAAAADARESPAGMLVPQAFLALLCLGLGLFPGLVVSTLGRVMASMPGLQPPREMVLGALGITPGRWTFDHLVPLALAAALITAAGATWLLLAQRRPAVRRAPTWGCGGELSASTEYTATAFSKPLMMIFRSVYRPTREVEALAEVSPYFPREVRYRAKIEPTFERYVYGPLTRGVLHAAERMKVLQAGSLHAYLGYVIALVPILVLFVWWTA
jgi:hydrogenase-4 component B